MAETTEKKFLDWGGLEHYDEKIKDEINKGLVDLSEALEINFDQSVIALSVDGKTVTYITGDGVEHTFETQDTDTTYTLATDKITGLTKLYAEIGDAEDGTMTQKAITEELDKKVGVSYDVQNNTLIFTK